MKPKFRAYELILLIAVLPILIVSCQKQAGKDSQSVNTQMKADAPNLLGSTNFVDENRNMDDQDLADADASADAVANAVGSAPAPCGTITYNPSQFVFPHTKTIVYNNCTTNCDGSVVNGTKTFTVFMNPADAQPGDTLIQVTYTQLTVNDTKVNGALYVIFVSNGPPVRHIVGHRTYVIPGADGGVKTYNADLITTKISATAHSTSGTVSGNENLHNGYVGHYTSVVGTDNPLIKNVGCCWYSKGVANISINVSSHGYTLSEVLDYGDGTCDDAGTLSINEAAAQPVVLPLTFYPLVP